MSDHDPMTTFVPEVARTRSDEAFVRSLTRDELVRVLPEQLRQELASLPLREADRCALGQAFTNAVRSVLADPATLDAIAAALAARLTKANQ